MNAEDIIKLVEYLKNEQNYEIHEQISDLKDYIDLNLEDVQNRIINKLIEYIENKFNCELPF